MMTTFFLVRSVRIERNCFVFSSFACEREEEGVGGGEGADHCEEGPHEGEGAQRERSCFAFSSLWPSRSVGSEKPGRASAGGAPPPHPTPTTWGAPRPGEPPGLGTPPAWGAPRPGRRRPEEPVAVAVASYAAAETEAIPSGPCCDLACSSARASSTAFVNSSMRACTAPGAGRGSTTVGASAPDRCCRPGQVSLPRAPVPSVAPP